MSDIKNLAHTECPACGSITANSNQAHMNILIKNLQECLALKDLEIMRLREALVDMYGCDDVKINAALSIKTTYDDLMSWHEAQLGEVVYVSHYSRTKEQVEGGCTLPVTLRKDK